MPDWKFGTILQREYSEDCVLVIGKTQVEDYTPTDGNSDGGIGKGSWVGITVKSEDHYGPWGEPGDTTWLLDAEWKVVK